MLPRVIMRDLIIAPIARERQPSRRASAVVGRESLVAVVVTVVVGAESGVPERALVGRVLELDARP